MGEIGDVDSWSDYAVDFNEHTYALRSTADEYTSDFSAVAVGRRSRWQTHIVSTQSAGRLGCPLAVINGKPVVCFGSFNADNETDELWFAEATTATPASSDDWAIHLIDDSFKYVLDIDLAVVDGKPAVVYTPALLESGSTVRFAPTTLAIVVSFFSSTR